MSGKIVVLHPANETRADAPHSPPENEANTGGAATELKPSGLSGKRIALLDNSKLNARELLHSLRQHLRAGYGIGETRMWRKGNSGLGAAFLPELLDWKPDLVLNAFGD